jgi:hypothetical protein
MLYGGVAWSEVPISTCKAQEPNGEIFDFAFIIDQYYGIQATVDPANPIVLDIQQDEGVDVSITQSEANTFYIDQQMEFLLEIDEDNTWSLS